VPEEEFAVSEAACNTFFCRDQRAEYASSIIRTIVSPDIVQLCSSVNIGKLTHENVKVLGSFFREIHICCFKTELEWKIGSVNLVSILIMGGQMCDTNFGQTVSSLAELLSQDFQLESISLTFVDIEC